MGAEVWAAWAALTALNGLLWFASWRNAKRAESLVDLPETFAAAAQLYDGDDEYEQGYRRGMLDAAAWTLEARR